MKSRTSFLGYLSLVSLFTISIAQAEVTKPEITKPNATSNVTRDLTMVATGAAMSSGVTYVATKKQWGSKIAEAFASRFKSQALATPAVTAVTAPVVAQAVSTTPTTLEVIKQGASEGMSTLAAKASNFGTAAKTTLGNMLSSTKSGITRAASATKEAASNGTSRLLNGTKSLVASAYSKLPSKQSVTEVVTSPVFVKSAAAGVAIVGGVYAWKHYNKQIKEKTGKVVSSTASTVKTALSNPFIGTLAALQVSPYVAPAASSIKDKTVEYASRAYNALPTAQAAKTALQGAWSTAKNAVSGWMHSAINSVKAHPKVALASATLGLGAVIAWNYYPGIKSEAQPKAQAVASTTSVSVDDLE